MSQNKVAALVLTITFLFVASSHSGRCEKTAAQTVAEMLPFAIHSVDGPKLTRSSLKEVFYRPGRKEIYLVTKSNSFLAFYLAHSQAHFLGQSKLVSSTSANGSPPTGTLGNLFEAHGQRISNIATGPKNSTLLPFLGDLDDRDPVLAYKVLPDKLLFLQEVQYQPARAGTVANR